MICGDVCAARTATYTHRAPGCPKRKRTFHTTLRNLRSPAAIRLGRRALPRATVHGTCHIQGVDTPARPYRHVRGTERQPSLRRARPSSESFDVWLLARTRRVKGDGGMCAHWPVAAGAGDGLQMQRTSKVAHVQRRERQAHAKTLKGRAEIPRIRVRRLACHIGTRFELVLILTECFRWAIVQTQCCPARRTLGVGRMQKLRRGVRRMSPAAAAVGDTHIGDALTHAPAHLDGS